MRRTSRLLATIGLMATVIGSVLLATNVTSASAATPTLSFTSTAAGVTCNNSVPTAPVCTGLAGGDSVTISGAGFDKGSLASIEQCSADLTQPQMLFLGNDVPVSCSTIAITSITGTGTLSGAKVVKSGTVGPPITSGTPTCTQTVPSTSAITGCTTSGNAATDAANFPCPPTSAQQAAGVTCVLAIGDEQGARGIGIICFTGETNCPASTTTTTTGASTTTTGATTTTTGATTTTTGAMTTTTGATATTTGATTTTTGATTTTTGATTTTTGATTTTTGATTTTTGATTTTTGATTTTEAPTTTTEASTTTTEGATTTTEGATTTTEGATTTTEGATTTTSGQSTTTSTPGTPVGVSGPYELYCPGTPVGDIALNNVSTVATITPSTLNSGTQFNVTGYQSTVNLPQQLASAAGALSPTLTGSATGKIDVTGGTPASMTTGTENFSLTIPSPVPSGGVNLIVPTNAASLGPFTASGNAVTVQNDSSTSLTLIVSGAPLSLTCTSYPNNTIATSGILPTGTPAPTAAPLAPVIAIAGGGSTATTAPPTPTTKPGTGGGGGGGTGGSKTPVVSSSQLAFTGVGNGVGLLGIVGGIMILLGLALLMLVDFPRRALSQLAVVAPAQWGRLRQVSVADRLAILNPMRLRRAKDEGMPDASVTATASVTVPATDDGSGRRSSLVARFRGNGDRFSRVPEMSRDFAQNTARAAVRAAQWLLGR